MGGGVVRSTFVFRLCQISLTFNTFVKSGGGGLFVQNYSSIRTVEKSDSFKKKLICERTPFPSHNATFACNTSFVQILCIPMHARACIFICRHS